MSEISSPAVDGSLTGAVANKDATSLWADEGGDDGLQNGIDSLSFLGIPAVANKSEDRDDFLTTLHLDEAGSSSPLDALKRSKSPNRVLYHPTYVFPCG